MDTQFLIVMGLALLPALGNFAGGIAAEWGKPSPQRLNWALHTAAGVAIAIVAIELMPRALEELSGWWIGLAVACGGGAYLLIDRFSGMIARNGDESRQRMWMIYFAVCADLFSDGIMIGAGAAVAPSLALILALGQVLADLPEGYATVANFRGKQVPKTRRLLLSASFAIPVLGAAAASFALLRAAPENYQVFALAGVAGLLTVAAVEDMLEEAHESDRDSKVSIFAFIGGFVLFTFVSAGLG